jgi:hypothetical protein
MIFLFTGILNGYELLFILAVYAFFLIYLLYNVFRKERGITVLIWSLIIIFIPIIGPLIYLIKLFSLRKAH